MLTPHTIIIVLNRYDLVSGLVTIRHQPERQKVEKDGGENQCSETYDGEEWNADVENILQALEETCERSQELLNMVNRVLDFLQGAFLIVLHLDSKTFKKSKC